MKNKEYLNKLKEKNIPVTPLGDYISMNTKIKHRNNTNNIIFFREPSEVLKGVIGKNSRNNDSYIKELEGYNIYPVEKYINLNTKIKHKLSCGHIESKTPKTVLRYLDRYLGYNCSCSICTIEDNNKRYLKKLESKQIKVIPLEIYKGSNIKIKHRCTCGNIWEVQPYTILNGVTCKFCGVNPKLNTKSYLTKLKELNIKVKPLEKYMGSAKKIKHRCTCGNIWEVQPKEVLSFTKCGCKMGWNKRYSGVKTILYYIYFEDIDVYKIGVTFFKNSVYDSIYKHRFGLDSKKYKIKILKYKVFEDGTDALNLEKKIIYENRDLIYEGDRFLAKNGESECLNKDISIDTYII